MSMFRTVYLVDVGILLTENDEEFESYNMCYDHKYGYYDEEQFYIEDKNKAIDYVTKYVNDGNPNTYGIVLKTDLPYDIPSDEVEDTPVEGEKYDVNDIIFNIAKINGGIQENFIKVN